MKKLTSLALVILLMVVSIPAWAEDTDSESKSSYLLDGASTMDYAEELRSRIGTLTGKDGIEVELGLQYAEMYGRLAKMAYLEIGAVTGETSDDIGDTDMYLTIVGLVRSKYENDEISGDEVIAGLTEGLSFDSNISLTGLMEFYQETTEFRDTVGERLKRIHEKIESEEDLNEVEISLAWVYAEIYMRLGELNVLETVRIFDEEDMSDLYEAMHSSNESILNAIEEARASYESGEQTLSEAYSGVWRVVSAGLTTDEE